MSQVPLYSAVFTLLCGDPDVSFERSYVQPLYGIIAPEDPPHGEGSTQDALMPSSPAFPSAAAVAALASPASTGIPASPFRGPARRPPVTFESLRAEMTAELAGPQPVLGGAALHLRRNTPTRPAMSPPSSATGGGGGVTPAQTGSTNRPLAATANAAALSSTGVSVGSTGDSQNTPVFPPSSPRQPTAEEGNDAPARVSIPPPRPPHRNVVFGRDGVPLLAHILDGHPDVLHHTTTPYPCPKSRSGHVLIPCADRNSLILHGGLGNGDGSLGDTWEYDVASGHWMELHCSAAGSRGDETSTEDDIGSGLLFRSVDRVPPPAFGQAATCYHDQHGNPCMFMVGGIKPDDACCHLPYSLNLNTGKWSVLPLTYTMPPIWGATMQTMYLPRRRRATQYRGTTHVVEQFANDEPEEEEEEVAVVFGGMLEDSSTLNSTLILHLTRPLTQEEVFADPEKYLSAVHYASEEQKRVKAVMEEELPNRAEQLDGSTLEELAQDWRRRHVHTLQQWRRDRLRSMVGQYFVEHVAPDKDLRGRRRPCSAVFEKHFLFVFGGRDKNHFYNDFWVLNLLTRIWVQVRAEMPTLLLRQFFHHPRDYTIGNYLRKQSQEIREERLREVERAVANATEPINPFQLSQHLFDVVFSTPNNSSASARTAACMVCDPVTRCLFVYGGFSCAGSQYDTRNDLHAYHIDENVWRRVPINRTRPWDIHCDADQAYLHTVSSLEEARTYPRQPLTGQGTRLARVLRSSSDEASPIGFAQGTYRHDLRHVTGNGVTLVAYAERYLRGAGAGAAGEVAHDEETGSPQTPGRTGWPGESTTASFPRYTGVEQTEEEYLREVYHLLPTSSLPPLLAPRGVRRAALEAERRGRRRLHTEAEAHEGHPALTSTTTTTTTAVTEAGTTLQPTAVALASPSSFSHPTSTFGAEEYFHLPVLPPDRRTMSTLVNDPTHPGSRFFLHGGRMNEDAAGDLFEVRLRPYTPLDCLYANSQLVLQRSTKKVFELRRLAYLQLRYRKAALAAVREPYTAGPPPVGGTLRTQAVRWLRDSLHVLPRDEIPCGEVFNAGKPDFLANLFTRGGLGSEARRVVAARRPASATATSTAARASLGGRSSFTSTPLFRGGGGLITLGSGQTVSIEGWHEALRAQAPELFQLVLEILRRRKTPGEQPHRVTARPSHPAPQAKGEGGSGSDSARSGAHQRVMSGEIIPSPTSDLSDVLPARPMAGGGRTLWAWRSVGGNRPMEEGKDRPRAAEGHVTSQAARRAELEEAQQYTYHHLFYQLVRDPVSASQNHDYDLSGDIFYSYEERNLFPTGLEP